MKKKPETATTPAADPTVDPAATAPGRGATGEPSPAGPDASSGQPSGPAGTAAADELAALKAEAAKAKEYWDLMLRTAADLENYKKRAARERQDAVKYANETLLQKLIPVLDTFDMAVAAAANTQGATQSLQTGITMILAQLRQALADAGLEEIDATGKAFDPNLHEALSQQDSADVPEGQVLQQMRKGYRLRDRLLRPAGVIVARKPDPVTPPA